MSDSNKALKEKLLCSRKNGFDRVDAAELVDMESYCKDYMAFLNVSRTERLCAAETVRLAEQAGYKPLVRGQALKAGDKVYVCNRGKSVLLAHVGSKPMSEGAQIAAAQGAGLTALARANEISRTAVLRLLDVGAQGVVVPCVETVEEVRELVRYAKFAPLGNRGFCPTRDGGWGHAAHAVSISGYMETSNRETLLLPQCETVGCLEHIEEITAMDGVDGIFVGPFDLSIALGHPGEFNAPVVHDAILRVQAACKRSGKLSIIFTGSAAASRQRFAEGFDSVTMGMDSLFYVEMYKNLVADVWGK